jgi:RNA polymerase sigma-70 factor (ECF subfamily)
VDRTSSSLLERLRQPADQAAWERFVELYTPLLYYWARRMALQQHDAADLVQEVFAILVQKLPKFRYDRDKSFRSWLRTVTMNKWREKCRHAEPAGDGSLGGLADGDSADEVWNAEYQQVVMRRALEIMQADFQPATWKACWALVVEGRSAAEASKELGLTENAVYLAKNRVLRRLRAELGEFLE